MSIQLTMATARARACELLTARGNKSGYARDVINGLQNWSGSDLRGKAQSAWLGCHPDTRLVSIEKGRVVSAIVIGEDLNGRDLYITDVGLYAAPQSGRVRCRKVWPV